MGFPGGTAVKTLPANAGDARDLGWIPGLGRSPGGGHGHSLQCSCLENPLDRGVRQATVHRVAQSQTHLKRLGTHTYIYLCVCVWHMVLLLYPDMGFCLSFIMGKCD